LAIVLGLALILGACTQAQPPDAVDRFNQGVIVGDAEQVYLTFEPGVLSMAEGVAQIQGLLDDMSVLGVKLARYEVVARHPTPGARTSYVFVVQTYSTPDGDRDVPLVFTVSGDQIARVAAWYSVQGQATLPRPQMAGDVQ
jgi:hypothetical protein